VDSLVSIKTKIVRSLAERLDFLAKDAGMSRAELMHAAIEHEVKQREAERLREEIALLEINQNILREGQSVPLAEEEDPALTLTNGHRCQLCLTELPPQPHAFQGPLFCDECLALAKGADFSALERNP
jgi:predicted DNA-binding protein